MTTAGRPRDDDITRRILAATISLALEGGYEAVRIEQVAKRAGCGKPAIYRRYAGRPQLVAAAAETILTKGTTPNTGDVVEDLVQWALVNKLNQSLPGVDAADLSHAISVLFEPAVFSLLWDSTFKDRRNQGEEILQRALDRGDFDADVDREAVLDVLSGLTFYRQSIVHRDTPTHLYRSVITALLANPPRISDRPEVAAKPRVT